MTPPKTPTKAERLWDLIVSLSAASVALNVATFCLDHHLRSFASLAFAIAGWIVVCAAIETKREQP